MLLSNSAPLFIPLVTWAWLKERIGGMVWASLLIGFAGVILILKPGRALLSDPIALIAIGAAVFSALALVAVNRLAVSRTAADALVGVCFSPDVGPDQGSGGRRRPPHRE